MRLDLRKNGRQRADAECGVPRDRDVVLLGAIGGQPEVAAGCRVV